MSTRPTEKTMKNSGILLLAVFVHWRGIKTNLDLFIKLTKAQRRPTELCLYKHKRPFSGKVWRTSQLFGKHVVVKILSEIELFNILNGIITWNGSIHNFKFAIRMSVKSKRPFELTTLKGLWPQRKDILHSFWLKTLNFYEKTQITIQCFHLDKTPLLMIFAYI